MNVDVKELADIIDNMIKSQLEQRDRTRTYKRGVVSAVSGQIASVQIEGNAIATQGVTALSHYAPVIGHKVLVASIGDTGSNLVILGRIPV